MGRRRRADAQDAGNAQRGIAGARDGGLGHGPSAAGAAPFEQVDEAAGVGAGIASSGEYRIVAGHLALDREAGVDPPDGGMKEENGPDSFLKEIRPVVVTAQVGEFVDEDGPERIGVHITQRPPRQHDGRVAEPQSRRNAGFVRHEQTDGAICLRQQPH